MASYNPLSQNNNSTIASSSVENRGLFSRLLRNLSNYGMDFTEMLRNTVSVGKNEDPYAQKEGLGYDYLSQKAIASVLNKQSIPYLNKQSLDKIKMLYEYAAKSDLVIYVDKIASEAIIYSDDKDFVTLKALSSDYSQDIQDKCQEYFEKIYHRYGFSDGITAWNLMKEFLITGYIANEIIWDDKKKNIIGFNQIDPLTLVPGYDPSIGNLWLQYPEDPQLRRIFLDSQIVFISYSPQREVQTSYLEGLIRPYNQLKLLEQTRIMFNVINASLHQVFTIPTFGMSKSQAEQQLGSLVSDLSESVQWMDTGELFINGTKQLPLNKQYWYPEGEHGKPSMELVMPQGNDLNEDSMLKWFMDILKTATKIPFQHLERENGGGSVYFQAADMTRDDIEYGTFINRLRTMFKSIILKPLKLQMCMEFPELKDDHVFLNQLDVIFNSNQLFEELKKISNIQKRIELISSMATLKKNNVRPYFHMDFLIDNYMQLTVEQKQENESYWIKNPDGGGETEEGGGSMDSGMGGGPQGGTSGGETQGGLPEGAQASQGVSETEGGETTEPTDVGAETEGDTEFEF